jgi:hypothetical protein
MKTVRDVTPPLTETQIAKKLSSENLDELLQLWRTEQGVAKCRDLELMAAALPFSGGRKSSGSGHVLRFRAMSAGAYGVAIGTHASTVSTAMCFSSLFAME